MKKIMMMMFGIVLLFASLQFIQGEIYLWNSAVIKNSTNEVSYHAFYQYLDTSEKGIGAKEDTRIIFYYNVEALPYYLTYGAVDYCNFTILHFKHTYDSTGEITNTTTEIQSIYFTTGALNFSSVTFLLRDKDSLIADMKCHYNDSRSLYEQNVLVGKYTTFMSSYSCSECSEFSLEQLSNMAQLNQNITASQVGVYYNVQRVVDFNYQAWLILSWIVRIGLIFVAIGLIFGGIYYFYVFFSNIGKEMSG